MKIQTICVLGGSGFVGRHLVNRLTRDGYAVRVPTRRRERHRGMLVNPRVNLVEADINDPGSLKAQLDGCQAVVNLVGILNESRAGGFRRAHVELAAQMVETARAQGVERLLHMSALNADPAETGSRYLQTKGEAEDAVHAAAGLSVTSYRPSVIFGPDDSFFNRFAQLLRLSPGLFPLACPEARFAPVYVSDVAEAFARALQDAATVGQRYELCGPHSYTLQALVEYTARTVGLKRWVVPLGDGLSRLQARVLEKVPGKPFSMDNYYSLQKDSVCTADGLARLGITASAVEAVVPQYLGQRATRARYSDWRRLAGR